MPMRHDIYNRLNDEVISLQNYDPGYFESFNPNAQFEKWTAVEVSVFDSIPIGMETMTLEEGLYAVFDYRGSSADPRIFQYIFTTWLPGSAYQLDHRPHFEILGAKYKNNDSNSEEEIWIPIKPK